MNKIVGFLISKEKRNLDVDFFEVGFTYEVICHLDFYIHFWGIGDLKKCNISNAFSLSFPLTDSLMDRNLLIELRDESIVINNDWLGSIPLFYNSEEIVISTIPQLCKSNSKLNFKEVINFCEIGFSILGNTIIENVKFLQFNSCLRLSKSTIDVSRNYDLALTELAKDEFEDEEKALELIENYLNNVISKFDGDVIVPVSGGLDSRLILSLINPDKKNHLNCYTYGINALQNDSFEVVYASTLCNKLGIDWKQIKLENIYKYIDKWYNIFGFSTHLHGMYHIEFYQKILNNKCHKNPILISGIVGDAWAGSIKFSDSKYIDFKKIAYSHNLSLDREVFHEKFQSLNSLFEISENQFSDYMINDKLKVLYTIRTKMILLSYLMTLPEYFGVPSFSPFLNYKIVKSMLMIKTERRINRQWQRDYFKSLGLDFENFKLKISKLNSLSVDLVNGYEFEKLSSSLLKVYFKQDIIEDINQKLLNPSLLDRFYTQSEKIPIWRRILKIIGVGNPIKKALINYTILKPIEIQLNEEG